MLINFIFHRFYAQLHENVINNQNVSDASSQNANLVFTNNKITEKLEELQKFERKLRGKKFLKYLIIFQSSGFLQENARYNREIETFLNQLSGQMTRIVDRLDSNSLHPFLNNYIYIDNLGQQNKQGNLENPAPFFKEKKPETPIQNQPFYPQQIGQIGGPTYPLGINMNVPIPAYPQPVQIGNRVNINPTNPPMSL